jgi:hypothetical protein
MQSRLHVLEVLAEPLHHGDGVAGNRVVGRPCAQAGEHQDDERNRATPTAAAGQDPLEPVLSLADQVFKVGGSDPATRGTAPTSVTVLRWHRDFLIDCTSVCSHPACGGLDPSGSAPAHSDDWNPCPDTTRLLRWLLYASVHRFIREMRGRSHATLLTWRWPRASCPEVAGGVEPLPAGTGQVDFRPGMGGGVARVRVEGEQVTADEAACQPQLSTGLHERAAKSRQEPPPRAKVSPGGCTPCSSHNW